MAHTIFGRNNTGNVKSKELYFLHYIFSAHRVHFVAFMLVHMRYVSTSTMGGIAIWEFITSIDHALNLKVELATLIPIARNIALDIKACRSHKFIKFEREERYGLMVKNRVVKSIFLPCSTRTNVKVKGNWLYNLFVGIEVVVPHTDALMDVGAGRYTDEEYDWRE